MKKPELTGRGLYFVSYLIRKYLYEEDIESIEQYENSLNECVEKLKNIYPDRITIILKMISTLYKETDKETQQKILNMFNSKIEKYKFLQLQQIKW